MDSNSHRKRRHWPALATALTAPALILASAAQAGTNGVAAQICGYARLVA